MNISLGLCKGRHEIPDVTGYMFDEILDPTNVNRLEEKARTTLSILFPRPERQFKNITAPLLSRLNPYRGCLTLYAAGLTVALLSVLNVCTQLNISLIVMHYDRETNSYYQQAISRS